MGGRVCVLLKEKGDELLRARRALEQTNSPRSAEGVCSWPSSVLEKLKFNFLRKFLNFIFWRQWYYPRAHGAQLPHAHGTHTALELAG